MNAMSNGTLSPNAESDATKFRYRNSQRNRTLIHPSLPQPLLSPIPIDVSTNNANAAKSHHKKHKHSFVVCADTQYGMTGENIEWETEMAYSRTAIQAINALEPRPLFCCMCGDLIDMVPEIYVGKKKPNRTTTANSEDSNVYTEAECNEMQDVQNQDFCDTWAGLHPDIAMVCICGNHDVGNHPNRAKIERFTNVFGDDYLAFWAGTTYNIVLNTNLFSDPSQALDLYQAQLTWLEDRLKAVHVDSANKPSHMFVFGHHPWFLYHEDEIRADLHGVSALPTDWGTGASTFPDSYFHIPLEHRKRVMELFKEYKVSAAFSGHFHQNLVSKSSFGMDMIVTSSLSMVFKSNGKPDDFDEPTSRGFRVVTVNNDATTETSSGTFQHKFISI